MKESKIEKSIVSLRKAILSELDGQSKKLKESYDENLELKKIVTKVADVIHNIPRCDVQEIEREIKTAWKIMDKSHELWILGDIEEH